MSVVADMKKLLLLVFASIAMVSTARAQYYNEDEIKPNQEADRQAITNLELGFARALQLNNSTIFNTVYSDDFSGVTWYGEVINKAKQIRNIQTSPATFDFVRCTDVQVKVFRDVASVTSLVTERGKQDGRPFVRQLRVLRVYFNTPRGWRVIAAQETQLPSQINK
jgi:ketosteroid isomerase-like protein